ncbi:MAG: cytochrome c [Pseudolabrys sp.]
MRVLLILSAVAVAASAHAQGSGNPVVRGRALAAEFCASCHAVGRSGASPNASAPPFRALGDKIELDDFARRLRQGLSSTHPAMPTFRFKPDDAHAVATYLLSIQK